MCTMITEEILLGSVGGDMKKFRLSIREGRIINTNPFIKLGKESSDLIKIIVAIFDLQEFTQFFNSIRVNKNIIITSFINGLLYWFHYHFQIERFIPIFSKFLGDGVMMVWEPGRQKLSSQDIILLMNLCWNMVSAESSYNEEYLSEFHRIIGKRYSDLAYPRKLKVGLSLGHAVKYTRYKKRTDYISESINIASRLVKYHKKIPFIAHSDLAIDIPKKQGYIEKSITLRGIGNITVYVDESDYLIAKSPSVFKNIK